MSYIEAFWFSGNRKKSFKALHDLERSIGKSIYSTPKAVTGTLDSIMDSILEPLDNLITEKL